MESRRGNIEIVATVGPASESYRALAALRTAGADAFRLNLAHASPEWLACTVDAVRRAAPDPADQRLIADLPGRKPRTGRWNGRWPSGPATRSGWAMRRAAPAGAAAVPFDLDTVAPVPASNDTVRLKRRAGPPRGARGPAGRPRDGVPRRWGADEPHGRHLGGRRGAAPRGGVDGGAGGVLGVGRPSVPRLVLRRPGGLGGGGGAASGTGAAGPEDRDRGGRDRGRCAHRRGGVLCIARGDLGTQVPPARLPGIERWLLEAARAAGKGMLLAGGLLPSAAAGRAVTRAERAALHYALVHGATGFILSEETAVGRSRRRR